MHCALAPDRKARVTSSNLYRFFQLIEQPSMPSTAHAQALDTSLCSQQMRSDSRSHLALSSLVVKSHQTGLRFKGKNWANGVLRKHPTTGLSLANLCSTDLEVSKLVSGRPPSAWCRSAGPREHGVCVRILGSAFGAGRWQICLLRNRPFQQDYCQMPMPHQPIGVVILTGRYSKLQESAHTTRLWQLRASWSCLALQAQTLRKGVPESGRTHSLLFYS